MRLHQRQWHHWILRFLQTVFWSLLQRLLSFSLFPHSEVSLCVMVLECLVLWVKFRRFFLVLRWEQGLAAENNGTVRGVSSSVLLPCSYGSITTPRTASIDFRWCLFFQWVMFLKRWNQNCLASKECYCLESFQLVLLMWRAHQRLSQSMNRRHYQSTRYIYIYALFMSQ